MTKRIFSMTAPMAMIVLILCTGLLLCGCAGKAADISSYGDTPITIAGLTEDDFTVTPNQLAELECVSRSASGTTEKAGEVAATGPLLATFLSQYSHRASDFDRIIFQASDGYETVLRDEYLTDYEVVMAVSGGSEPLAEEEQPLRLLIPGAESGKWIYGVIRIQFDPL